MAAINEILIVGATLLFVALLLSALSQRVGIPVLLVFLAVGLFATEIPGVPRYPVSIETAALIGNLALAVILLDGGLRTRSTTFRMVAAPALVLATVGVVLTAAIVGALAVWLLGFDWRYGLLIGSIVGSTDAAAVFALLRSGGQRLNERVEATLEVESGVNDPMAVFLTLMCIELIRLPQIDAATLLHMFAAQLGVGLIAGFVLGRLLAALVARIRLNESLLALLIQSGGLLIFGAAALAGGSGFLAIYLAGLLIGNRRAQVTEDVLRASDGLAWLAQAGMFLILGIVTDPKELAPLAPLALTIALGMIFVARPLAVAACLLPFRYPAREILFIGWMGLRGAVPIVLGLFPLLAGIEGAALLFHVAFFCVLASLLLQGGSLRASARLAGVTVTDVSPILASAALHAADSGRALVQLRVMAGAPVAERPREEVTWPPGVGMVEVQRGGQTVTGQRLVADDVVALAAPTDAVDELEAMFAPAPELGEFTLAPDTTLADLRDYYGCAVPAGAHEQQTLGAFLRERLHGRPAAGDSVRLGGVILTVRAAAGGVVKRVGLRAAAARPTSRS